MKTLASIILSISLLSTQAYAANTSPATNTIFENHQKYCIWIQPKDGASGELYSIPPHQEWVGAYTLLLGNCHSKSCATKQIFYSSPDKTNLCSSNASLKPLNIKLYWMSVHPETKTFKTLHAYPNKDQGIVFYTFGDKVIIY
ncbi:MAG: hypothetical protein K0S08_1739 [Gammaproteobacteria bacterium]|jgi:hypothetical protein|nr:hypothetical protein [Gammaproteobacteria bacterium]